MALSPYLWMKLVEHMEMLVFVWGGGLIYCDRALVWTMSWSNLLVSITFESKSSALITKSFPTCSFPPSVSPPTTFTQCQGSLTCEASMTSNQIFRLTTSWPWMKHSKNFWCKFPNADYGSMRPLPTRASPSSSLRATEFTWQNWKKPEACI